MNKLTAEQKYNLSVLAIVGAVMAVYCATQYNNKINEVDVGLIATTLMTFVAGMKGKPIVIGNSERCCCGKLEE